MSYNTNVQPTVQQITAEPVEVQVMDVSLDEELGEDIPLTSRCYMSNTKDIKMVPGPLADYTCRWIHLESGNPSFDQFRSIVDDLMRDYDEKQRRVVQDGLRRFRGQNEVRGSYGPAFRPACATLQSDPSQDDESSNHSHEIPVFYSLPTVDFETLMYESESSPPFTLDKPHASSSSSSVSFSSSSHISSESSSLSSLSPSSQRPTLPSSSMLSLPPPASMPSSSTPPAPPGIPPPVPAPPSANHQSFLSAAHAAMSTSESTPKAHHSLMEIHSTKSLLQYSYRFGKDPRGREKPLLSSHFSATSMEPTVHETWCLVVDKRNLVTVSRLAGAEIWPMGLHTSSSILDGMPNCLRMVAWDYLHFQSHLGDLDGWTEFAISFPAFSTLLFSVFAIFLIMHDLISVVIPVVWIPAYLPRILVCLIVGREVGLSLVLRALSVAFTLLRTTRYGRKLQRGKKGHLFMGMFARFLSSLGCYAGCPNLELSSATLTQHIDHWIEVEEKMRSQEEPPEEVFKALRRLWIITIHFSMNFFAAPDGKVYRLNVYCAERRLLRIISKGIRLLAQKMGMRSSKVQDAQPDMLKISQSPRGKGETLQDLETEFLAAVDNLARQLNIANADIEIINQSENREMLKGIHRSAECPAMSCMLRMCTITSPTRFVIASRDIGDLYARWIAQEEYLMRDSVTQSLIYLISNTEDELRILKGILNSQQKVIAQVAKSYANALVTCQENNQADSVVRMGDLASRGTDQRKQSHTTDTFQGLLDSLQRRSPLKYDILMSEIQRHEESVARLKAQSALLISIKTERQGVAIFVFTLVTIVFLPLSFVTSYLGMNTSDIRDMTQGQGLFWTFAGPLTVFVLFVSWLIARRGPTWKLYRQRKRLRDVEDWKWRYRD